MGPRLHTCSGGSGCTEAVSLWRALWSQEHRPVHQPRPCPDVPKRQAHGQEETAFYLHPFLTQWSSWLTKGITCPVASPFTPPHIQPIASPPRCLQNVRGCHPLPTPATAVVPTLETAESWPECLQARCHPRWSHSPAREEVPHPKQFIHQVAGAVGSSPQGALSLGPGCPVQLQVAGHPGEGRQGRPGPCIFTCLLSNEWFHLPVCPRLRPEGP